MGQRQTLSHKTFKISNFRYNILLWHHQTQEHEFGCFYTTSIHKNHLRNKNMPQSLFKKHSKFQTFDKIFYCCTTRLRNTNLNVFIQIQHTRTILRNKNMVHSLFKKYSKFQKLDEILYCWMIRFRNVKLGVFRQIKAQKLF